MSNVTKTFNVYKDMTYTIGMRSWGKEDLVKSFRGQPEETTISRNDMQNYVLSGIEMQSVVGDSKAVIDFSNVKLPWKFEHSDKLLTSRFAIAPLGTTVTQPKYVKKLNVTKVGSPTITEDFIASGFSSSSYLTASTDNLGNNCEYFFKATTGSDISTFQNIMSVYPLCEIYVEDGQLKAWNESGVNSPLIAGNVNTNSTYYVRISQQGGKLQLGYSIDNVNWTYSSAEDTACDNYEYFRIGWSVLNLNQRYWRGSIDLKECYVKKNGAEVWRGIQWVDRIFNATIKGSPTVTEDFVASGFSDYNYFTYTLQEALGNDYEVLLKFHTPNTAQSGGQVILSLADDRVPVQEMQNIYITLNNGGTLLYAKTGNGSTNTLLGAVQHSIQNNTDYYIKLVSTPSSTTFYASTTGFTNMTMVETVNASLSLTNKLLRFGYDADNTAKSYLKGSIDFKECSIKKNGVEIWRGVEDLGTETLSGCVRYYYGEGEHVTTPPSNSTQYYNIYAVNGDEGIVLDSTYYHEGTMVYNRPILGDGEIPQFENEWYLGEYRVETGENGFILVPIDKPDTAV